jgi:biotin carboxylase
VKKILILGAGVYQMPLIKRAKDHGFYVIVASYSSNDIGVKFADESLEIDTTDKLRLLKYSENTGIDAITTAGTDVAVPTIGYICDKMQLPGLSSDTAYLATNKIAMKNKFTEFNVPTPEFSMITNLKELYDYAKNKGYPFIVKAPDSSGSKGLTVVNDFNEIEYAFFTAMNVSRCSSIIAEEYLSGMEFSANLIVENGQVVEYFMHHKTLTNPPITVPICNYCPSIVPLSVQTETVAICDTAAKSLTIKNAVCNVDVLLTDEGIKVIEFGARLGSIGIPEIVYLYHGVNLYDIVLDLAFDSVPRIQKKYIKPAAYQIIPSPASGILNHRTIPDEILKNPNVISIDFDYPLGTPVREFKTGPDRIGNILVTGKSSIEAKQFAAEVLRSIRIRVDPDAALFESRSVV